MSSTFKKSTTDDFNGMLALMPKKQVNSSGNTEAVCMSKFTAGVGDDHDTIINGNQLNQHLTQIYSTRGETETSTIEKILMWSPDENRPAYVGNLGTYDRLVWAGKFENLGGTDGTVFKHAVVEGSPTDGFMYVPTPYFEFTPGQSSSLIERALPDADGDVDPTSGGGHVNAESFRIKLRFNNLQPKTFVPLFGYVTSWGQAPEEVNNAMGTMYTPGNGYQFNHTAVTSRVSSTNDANNGAVNAWYYQYYCFPGGIASSNNNIYGYGVSANSDYEGGTAWNMLSYDGKIPFSEPDTAWNDILSTYNAPHNTNMYLSNTTWRNNHIYGRFRSETCRHTVVYYLYAYDNNGKGMIVQCAGEQDEYEAMQNAGFKTFSYKPSNGYFGQSNRNGYLDFVAPFELTSFLSDAQNDLTDLYNKYDPATYDQGIGIWNDATQESPYRIIYHHHNDLFDDHIEGAGNNSSGWWYQYWGVGTNWNKTFDIGLQQKIGWIKHQWFNYSWAVNTANTNVTASESTYLNFVPNTTTSNSGIYKYPCITHYMGHSHMRQDFKIIAFGDVSNNINLSNWEEILINVNTLIGRRSASSTDDSFDSLSTHTMTSSYRYDWEQSNLANKTVTYADNLVRGNVHDAYFENPVVKLYTGKILNFIFRDVPGQKYYGYTSTSVEFWNPTASGPDSYQASGGPCCLILRPSFRSEGEIHSFSYSAYHNSYDQPDIGGTGKLRGEKRSSDSTEYLFSKIGYSYNPLQAASTNTGAFTDPNSSLSNPLFLLDSDETTRGSITKEGIANAIYISLNDAGSLFTDTGNEDQYEIAHFCLFFRGVTLSALNYHDIKMSVVDAPNSSATTLFASVPTENFSNKHITEVPINNISKFPGDKSAYAITFNAASTNVIRYDDLQNAYLKIWVEVRT